MTGILDTKYLIIGNSAGDIGMAETIFGGLWTAKVIANVRQYYRLHRG